MKPDFFDLNDESIFVDTILHPGKWEEYKKKWEEYKKMYLVIGVIGLISLSFFLIPLIMLVLTGQILLILLFGIPLLIALTTIVHRFLEVKIISDYGVFITNRKGNVKRGISWSETEKIKHEIIRGKESKRTFSTLIKPAKGRMIQLQQTCPVVAAYILVFCLQKTPNGDEQIREIIHSVDKKNKFFSSSKEILFKETLETLIGKEIMIQQIQEQKQLSVKRSFDETEFKIYQ